MVISRTPYRISFFGGGSDYPAWYLRHGGAVLAATIDKYCYLSCRFLPPFFEHRFRLVYSRIENCQSVDEINHPAVREVLRYLNLTRGLEIHHDGDLPARSGMGSSSAFTVGLLHALSALLSRKITRAQLARESIHLEQDRLGETVGSQDQVLAAHGGLSHVVFHPSGEISVQPVAMRTGRLAELQEHLMLFYTGIRRTSSEIAANYAHRLTDPGRMWKLMELVHRGLGVLLGDGNLDEFGLLLHEAWIAKSSLAPVVTNSVVDEIYAAARQAGATGGKLLGAGGGGFMLLFVPPERRSQVQERLSRLVHVPFAFEQGGSQIVFQERQRDYSREEADRDRRMIPIFRELAEISPVLPLGQQL